MQGILPMKRQMSRTMDMGDRAMGMGGRGLYPLALSRHPRYHRGTTWVSWDYHPRCTQTLPP